MSSCSPTSLTPAPCLMRPLTWEELKVDGNLCAACQTDLIQGIAYKQLFCQVKTHDNSQWLEGKED